MTKKGHTNPKTIDTNLKIIKLYSLILIFIISGCDFRTPETWETPTWYLPLYIPLFNDSITLGDLIDTEGSEYEILSSFDFNKYKPLVFTVEHNFTDMEIKIDKLMKKNGYNRIFNKITIFDAWYVLESTLKKMQ